MKVIDQTGQEHIYQNIYSASLTDEGWKIPLIPDLMYRQTMALNDWDENIPHIEYLEK